MYKYFAMFIVPFFLCFGTVIGMLLWSMLFQDVASIEPMDDQMGTGFLSGIVTCLAIIIIAAINGWEVKP